ncbi:MAG TPA: DUF2244 domain-containing protein [Steroidobacteraceae bacterium]|nr:DUF2244 domain-containing protein [Steroidobacteraceae bacterium]
MTDPHHINFDLIPHCSLSVRGAVVFFGFVCFVTLGIAGTATLLGFWPILPFAGLEMAVLAWALHANMQRRFECESIDVTQTEVIVEHRSLKVGRSTPHRIVFPRHWARVKIRAPKSPLHRGQLVIESHGRAREVGKFLTEEERRHLAAKLRLLIGDMNQSPDLPGPGSP